MNKTFFLYLQKTCQRAKKQLLPEYTHKYTYLTTCTYDTVAATQLQKAFNGISQMIDLPIKEFGSSPPDRQKVWMVCYDNVSSYVLAVDNMSVGTDKEVEISNADMMALFYECMSGYEPKLLPRAYKSFA